MMAQVLFYDIFSEKELHLNAVESSNAMWSIRNEVDKTFVRTE